MAPRDKAAYARLNTWRNSGRTATLVRPLDRVAGHLRAHGYTVYAIGDEHHMLADPPEDHTPYSRTGYPGVATYGRLYAIDVMPPAAGARSKLTGLPLPSLQQLGAQLVQDRQAGEVGARWLKYINWEPEGNYTGPCYQDSWLGGYHRAGSSDRGHIHASAYTGLDDSDIADGYDLVARVHDEGDDDMSAQANAILRWFGVKSGTPGQPYVPEEGSPARDLGDNVRRLKPVDERLQRVETDVKAVRAQLEQVLQALQALKE